MSLCQRLLYEATLISFEEEKTQLYCDELLTETGSVCNTSLIYFTTTCDVMLLTNQNQSESQIYKMTPYKVCSIVNPDHQGFSFADDAGIY